MMRHSLSIAPLQAVIKASRSLLCASCALVAFTSLACANPEDGVVQAGHADILSAGNVLTVTQHSDRAVIDWRSFNIAADEATRFDQPNSSAIALNRVKAADPSYILGELTANGNVVLINPNGVFFGRGARVDVNGLIATTADIDNNDFMAGSMAFDKPGRPNAVITNNGTIAAKDAGLVGLVAPSVENNGTITARLGRIELASGDTFTADLYGDGLMEIAVSDDVQEQLVSNTGSLNAAGGTIRMYAAAGNTMVNSLVSASGELKAPALVQKNGKIIIGAAGSNKTSKAGQSTTMVHGLIDASGYEAGQKGGSVEITGDNVALLSGTIIDASGDRGGGNIKVGGDYLGSGSTQTARNTYVDPHSFILNDAITLGDGGRTIVWSDQTTDFYGNIYGRGGVQGGNGGFVETSGKENLLAQGFVDLTAVQGDKGEYLLDPATITIQGNFLPTGIAGNILWLDATQITGKNNGDLVGVWDDMGTANNDATAFAGGPTYIASGINGKPTLRFSGSGGLRTSAVVLDDWTFYVVYNASTTNDSYERLVDHSYTNGFWLGRNNTAPNSFGGGVKEGAPPYGRFINVTDGQSHIIANTRNNTTHTIWSESGFSSGVSGAVTTALTTNSPIGIGSWNDNSSPGQQANGVDFGEVIVFDSALSADARALLEQYQSVKWGVGLLSSSPATEASLAMNSGSGYGAFTTRYLEKLANTADIILQAGTSIHLDLKGDTLNLTGGARNDKSITLQTTNGNIATSSAGTIITNRTAGGGNITLTAGGAGNIQIDHALVLDAQNGGSVTLTALGGAVSAPAGLSTPHGTVFIDSGGINGNYTGFDAVFDSHSGNITATVGYSTLNIKGASANLSGGYIGAVGPASQAMANLIKVNGVQGPGTASYRYSNFNIGYVSPSPMLTPSAVLPNTVSMMVQGNASKDAGSNALPAMNLVSSIPEKGDDNPGYAEAILIPDLLDIDDELVEFLGLQP